MSAPSSVHVSLSASVFAATADERFHGGILLVQIDLKEFDAAPARTLRFANVASSSGKSYKDPDGNTWQPVLRGTPSIDHGGEWLAVDMQPVDAIVVLRDIQLAGQAEGEKVSTLFADYQPIGAVVTIYQAFDNLTSVNEFRTIFYGEVARVDYMDLASIKLHCVEPRGWAGKFPSRVVTLAEFADAPKQSLGVPPPIVTGDWGDGNRYLKVADAPSTAYESYLAGIARGHAPMLVVEAPTGTGIEAPRAIICDDQIDQGVLPGGYPYDIWYMYEPGLDTVVGGFAGTLSNPAGGPADLTLDGPPEVFGAILPLEAHSTNTALYAEDLLRKDKPLNLEGYAQLDFDANQKALRVLLPDISPLGVFVEAWVYCFYQAPTNAGTAPRLGIFNEANALNDVADFSGTSTGYVSDGFEAVKTLQVTVAATGAPLTYDWDQIKNCYVEVLLRAAGQQMRVHRMTLVVRYKPSARIERPGIQRTIRTGTIKRGNSRPGGGGLFPAYRDTTSPDIVSFDAPLLNYPLGPKDTAGGIYTGTPGLLIEHPVDMVRYLLIRHRGVASGSIVETSGEFGAFPDAKTALSGYVFRAIFSERLDVREHIARIGAESMCWFKRCPTLPGAPFVAVPWEVGSTVNYRDPSDPFVFYRNHVVAGSFRVGYGSISDVANVIRVNYDWDPRTNTYGKQQYITPTTSRVYLIGDFFTTDATRESEAAESATLYGEREDVLSLQMVTNDSTALSILQRRFDLTVNPPLTVAFETKVSAYDLNRGHVITFAPEWDERIAYPKAGSDGSWASKYFRVVNVKRLAESPAKYAVQAVEV